MIARFNRRTLLSIAAVGTAAAATGLTVVGGRACLARRGPAAAESAASAADYVDRDGWMLTPADEKALDGPPQPVHP